MYNIITNSGGKYFAKLREIYLYSYSIIAVYNLTLPMCRFYDLAPFQFLHFAPKKRFK